MLELYVCIFTQYAMYYCYVRRKGRYVTLMRQDTTTKTVEISIYSH